MILQCRSGTQGLPHIPFQKSVFVLLKDLKGLGGDL